MKKFSKVLTILLALTMLLTSARSVHADPTTPPTPGSDTTYEPAEGKTTEFTKYLITNEGQKVPDLDFEYEIKAGKAQESVIGTPSYDERWTYDGTDYTTKELAEAAAYAKITHDTVKDVWVYKEIEYETEALAQAAAREDIQHKDASSGLFEIKEGLFFTDTSSKKFPNVSTAKFGMDDPRNHQRFEEIQAGDTISPDRMTEGRVYSKDTVTVDFAGVEFKEPGVYRYIITEQLVKDSIVRNIQYDTETNGSMKRVLDVYVVDYLHTYYVQSDQSTPGAVQADGTDTYKKKDGTTWPSGTYVLETSEHALKIQEYVLHETETEINMTGEFGSHDKEAIESGWAISNDLTTVFDTKAAAEAELARRKSVSTTAEHFDQSIVDKQAEIDNLKQQIADKKAQLSTAETTAGIPAKQAAVDAAQTVLDKLIDGDDTTGLKTIEQLVYAISVDKYYVEDNTGTITITAENQNQYLDEYGEKFDIGTIVKEKDNTTTDKEAKKADLKKYGKTALYNALVEETVAPYILVLREVISELDTAIGIAESALNNAKQILELAKAPLAELEQEIADLEEQLAKLNRELADLVARHENAIIVAVRWTLGDKTDHYTNEVLTYNLEFGKEVEGNQGARDKYFKFTMKLEGFVTSYCRLATEEEKADPTTSGARVTQDGDKDINGISIPQGEYVIDVAVEPTIITIDSDGSIFTRDATRATVVPTRTNSTKADYTSEIMAKANGVDEDPYMTYADTVVGGKFDDFDATEFVWTDSTATNTVYKYEGSAWTKYVNDVKDDSFSGVVPDDAEYIGLPGQQLISDDNGVIEHTFYLKDGEYILIKDLPSGIKYTITEVEEDYKKENGTDKVAIPATPAVADKWLFNNVEYDTLQKAKEAVDAYNQTAQAGQEKTYADIIYKKGKPATDAKLHDDPTTGVLNENKYTGYTNTRNGIIPTGVMAAAGTGALIVGAGIIGMLVMSRKKEEDEE